MKSDSSKVVTPTLLKPSTVAARLDCHKGKVYALVRRGELKKVYLGDDMRIPLESLEGFIAKLPSKGSSPPRGQGRKPKQPKGETTAAA